MPGRRWRRGIVAAPAVQASAPPVLSGKVADPGAASIRIKGTGGEHLSRPCCPALQRNEGMTHLFPLGWPVHGNAPAGSPRSCRVRRGLWPWAHTWNPHRTHRVGEFRRCPPGMLLPRHGVPLCQPDCGDWKTRGASHQAPAADDARCLPERRHRQWAWSGEGVAKRRSGCYNVAALHLFLVTFKPVGSPFKPVGMPFKRVSGPASPANGSSGQVFVPGEGGGGMGDGNGIMDHEVGQSASRPVGQSASRPVGQSASRPVGQSASRPVGQSASRPVGQSASRPVGQSASRPVYTTSCGGRG